MELGADGVLLNTAVAQSKNPAQMASAMNLGVQAGRLGYLAGRMDKKIMQVQVHL
jgi:thiazole synthase